ncbi:MULTISPECIES: acyl carrier protein [Paenibacillus]|uniref:D-alanyl carrier protein n=1 Tax=Paenibacillus helianthi TaxID=1349432 RepID=A0ABX3EIY8_9BACL|nr:MULTISPECIES: acyl carrier protein [Paenibacillus]OKP83275.1 D-alanyl carrier protein [Paenibacillus helianthi]OKP92314.1 D-alanyl carrier protein [Paenibacillus sp. P3E]OKP92674.1 D-alanyl carrier protein [Paenibacillus sp. P32E]OKP97032.1 D-alanyl carrier protein [Paenibacillus sp. P46E]
MQQKVIEIIAEIKEEPGLLQTLNGASDLTLDAALDSLQIINFILRIEDEFDVEVDFDTFDLEHLKSVDRFSDYVAGLAVR